MKKQILTFPIFLTLFFLFLWGKTVWADVCGSQSWYGLYECRVENICRDYESDKPVYTVRDYEAADDASWEFHNSSSRAPAVETAKVIYRENMGNIYKCGIIQSQRNTLEKLSEFIRQESSGQLSDAIGGQIDQRITRLERSSVAIWCSLTDDEAIQNKLAILRETSHEACRYISYLEYTKLYYSDLSQFSSSDIIDNYGTDVVTEKYASPELPKQLEWVQNEIAAEIAHTYKVFPIAYHAYSEYENNFPIHFLLEILRADFLVLRRSLYQSIMPLAQLGLKVINAMSY